MGNGHAGVALPAPGCSSLHSHGAYVVVPTPFQSFFFFFKSFSSKWIQETLFPPLSIFIIPKFLISSLP